ANRRRRKQLELKEGGEEELEEGRSTIGEVASSGLCMYGVYPIKIQSS
ncbi:hypothetical protein A2U01_0063807, partial [Trifolium medium]|nr:hypothetical protein [Trifolium medium]